MGKTGLLDDCNLDGYDLDDSSKDDRTPPWAVVDPRNGSRGINRQSVALWGVVPVER